MKVPGSPQRKKKPAFVCFKIILGKTVQLQWGRKLAPPCEKIQEPIKIPVPNR
jgi:hypothetical protein